eukprot:SAG31_NODE_1450_length_8307_cov_3.676657_4_plen_42_part_00
MDKSLVDWLEQFFPRDREPQIYLGHDDLMRRMSDGLADYGG